LITGTIVFWVAKSNNKIGWLNWIIGNGTYLYYLTVLLVCYILLFKYASNKVVLIVVILVNVILIILTSYGFLVTLSSSIGFKLNNYLNVLNWIGYFALGILAKDWLYKILSIINQKFYFVVFVYLGCLIASLYIEPYQGGYFSKFAIPLQIMGGLMILSISTLRIFDNHIINETSKFTFAVYLTHFLIFPIKRLMFHSIIFDFVNPLVILLVNVLFLIIGLKIAKLLKIGRLYKSCLGIRQ
jgi:hypothetical protein